MSLAGSAPLHSGQSVPSNDATPSLSEPREPVPESEPRTIPDGEGDDKKKQKKRTLFGFGKKKADDPATATAAPTSSPGSPGSTASPPPPPPEKDRPSRRTAASPLMLPSSPGRGAGGALASPPRIASPAGSQIFERDVQDSTSVAGLPTSPAIPSHITTENHIPPVLDASSEAITDDHLDPDSVEIITHAAHQPAAVTVTGAGGNSSSVLGGTSTPYDAMAASWADELASSFGPDARDPATADAASNYGSFDTTDVRRLSFISFADVVQAEQQQQQQHHHHAGAAGSRDSMHLAGLTSLSTMGMHNRSPSPIRSAVSSQGGGPGTSSPPTSKSGSVKGLELSPTRKPLGSPPLLPAVAGEIAIETMSQALRRTGSGDLSGVRSLPTSPIEGPSR